MTEITAFFLGVTIFFSSFFGSVGFDFGRSVSIARNDLSRAGYALTDILIDRCYNTLTHKIAKSAGDSGTPFIWPAASFTEALADAYRLYPGSLKLRAAYTDLLKNGLSRYLISDVRLETPAGDSEGISYYATLPGNTGDYYYDDNEWVCIQLLLGYLNTGDSSLLEAAEKNLEFIWTGWDDTAGGGIYWSHEYSSKNACSNAPAAIAFLMAHQITGKDIYLERGRMIYDWVNKTMREGDLFCDSVNLDGTVRNRWKGAYNQATMIYAGSLLHEITKKEEYLTITKATVDAAVSHIFTKSEENGETVYKMNGNPIYKAWCIGWLMRSFVKFYETAPQKDGRPLEICSEIMRSELETKDSDGFYDPFFLSGEKDPENYTELLAQCGVACAFLNTAYYETKLK